MIILLVVINDYIIFMTDLYLVLVPIYAALATLSLVALKFALQENS